MRKIRRFLLVIAVALIGGQLLIPLIPAPRAIAYTTVPQINEMVCMDVRLSFTQGQFKRCGDVIKNYGGLADIVGAGYMILPKSNYGFKCFTWNPDTSGDPSKWVACGMDTVTTRTMDKYAVDTSNFEDVLRKNGWNGKYDNPPFLSTAITNADGTTTGTDGIIAKISRAALQSKDPSNSADCSAFPADSDDKKKCEAIKACEASGVAGITRTACENAMQNCLDDTKITDKAICYSEIAKGNTDIKTLSATINQGDGEDASLCGSFNGVLGSALSWFMCPLSQGLADFAGWMASKVADFLYTPSDIVFSPDMYKAWSQFRNFALALVLIAGLIMVISQALGLEILDAYTIKKLMPRLGIVLAGIALSWPILKFFIEFFNDSGIWIYDIIMFPFKNMEGGIEDIGAIFNLGAVGGGFLVGLFAGVDFIGILSLLGTMTLALIIGLIVLSIRHIIIITTVLMSPLIIAAYVLPGTQKLWKFGKQTFFTANFIFPIIMGMLATGAALSRVTITSGDQSVTSKFIGLLIFFAPYFMIPFAFKIAGGAMSTLASLASDKSGGVFGALKKGRQGRRGQVRQDLKQGNRFKYPWAQGVNQRLAYAANISKAGPNPFQMRSRMRTYMDDTAHGDATKFMQENADFAAIKEDDAKLWAAKYTTRQQIEDELERRSSRFRGPDNAQTRADAANQILRAQKAAGRDVFQKARVRAQAPTGTAYYDANDNLDLSQMIEDVHSAYGSDRNGAWRALNEMRSALTQSGQIAGQASYSTWVTAFDNYQSGAYTNTATGQIDRQAIHNTIMDDAINQANPGYALHGKPTSAAAMGAAHARRIQAIATGIANNTHTQEDLDAATAAAAGILDAMGQASPANASAFASELMGVTIHGSSQTGAGGMGQAGPDLTVREMIEDRMANPEYANRRRDLGHSILAQAQMTQAQAQAQAQAQGQGQGQGGPAGPGAQTGPAGP